MLKFLTSKKAQLSVEFMIFVGLAFFVVVIFVAISASEAKNLRNQNDFFLLQDVGLALQKEASVAATVEDGYRRQFTVPTLLDSRLAYTITTTNTSITFETEKTVYVVSIPGVVGNFTKGTNTIERINKTVYLNR